MPDYPQLVQEKLDAYHDARDVEQKEHERIFSTRPEYRTAEMFVDWGRTAIATDRAWEAYKVIYNDWIQYPDHFDHEISITNAEAAL